MDTEKIAASNLSTEQKIIKAAAQAFTEKGYQATTTRDIAKLAGIRLGSLHYYFRSKEKLFQIVTEQAIRQFATLIHSVFENDKPFKDKIRLSVAKYTDFFIENPFLPLFILNESERDPSNLFLLIDFKRNNELIHQQLQDLAKAQRIKPITIEDFISNLVGLTIFPFISRHMIGYITGIDKDGFREMLERRKITIPEMIIKDLFLE